MKRIRDRVGGLDVHRDTVVACVRVVDPDGPVSELAAFDHLTEPTLVVHLQRHFAVSFATLRVRLLQERLISRPDYDALGEMSPSRLAVGLATG